MYGHLFSYMYNLYLDPSFVAAAVSAFRHAPMSGMVISHSFSTSSEYLYFRSDIVDMDLEFFYSEMCLLLYYCIGTVIKS
jgi:hypothetical protein